MGLYNDRVLPRLTDLTLGKLMDETRQRVTAGLDGEVLEIGFGSGRNLPHLPATVTRLFAVEPSAGGRKLARTRMAEAPVPVEFVGTDGAELPFPDGSVDNVLVTWTLCTIPDIYRALQEVRRVLRLGGTMHFAEHGRSPRAPVALWQDRLTPLWGRVFGGCHLNRPIDVLIEGSGLTLDTLRTYNMGGPELMGFAYEGVASKRG
jgi:ubiquinone/menaquinone biosynthesis C-methylase UbiE